MTTTTNKNWFKFTTVFLLVSSVVSIANPDYWRILSTGFNRRLAESSCNFVCIVELLAELLLEILQFAWLNF